jgi:hypothetical protein
MRGCHRCGYLECECWPCAACAKWTWSERLTVNPDGDGVCPDCAAAGARSPEAIEADRDNELDDIDHDDQEANAA